MQQLSAELQELLKRDYFTAGEVAHLFRVDPKTVTRWAKAGRIPGEAIITTLGGHRRYDATTIRAMLKSRR